MPGPRQSSHHPALDVRAMGTKARVYIAERGGTGCQEQMQINSVQGGHSRSARRAMRAGEGALTGKAGEVGFRQIRDPCLGARG
jgi:hypothetical protein